MAYKTINKSKCYKSGIWISSMDHFLLFVSVTRTNLLFEQEELELNDIDFTYITSNCTPNAYF
jgi:hypothetical protein